MCKLCSINPELAEAFAGKMIQTFNHGALSTMISLGHRVGIFDVMAELGPATIESIADNGNYSSRYVKEWLAVMVTGQVVEYNKDNFHYTLPAEHAAFLTRAAGKDNLSVLFQFIPVWTHVEDDLVECFKHGGGVPYEKNESFHRVMAEESDKNFQTGLVDAMLPLADGLIDRLETGITVLDIGTGAGAATIELAKRFPNSSFLGIDICEWPLEQAKAEAKRQGIGNVKFVQQDATKLEFRKQFDLITTFDAIHDQAHPDVVLRNIHQALKDDGTYFMMDINAATNLEDNLAHPVATAFYTMSLTHCMTVSLAQGGMGLGTMWGREKSVEMLNEAGFENIATKTLEGDFINIFYISEKGQKPKTEAKQTRLTEWY